MTRDADDVQAVAKRILKYFERHPNAADTAAGIRRFWLIDEPVGEPSVQAALDSLVALHLVEPSTSDPPVYKRSRAGDVTH